MNSLENVLWVVGEVEFLGFTAPAHQLQRSGWKFSSYKAADHRFTETIVAEHPSAGYIKCEITDDWRDLIRDRSMHGMLPIRMRGSGCHKDIIYNIQGQSQLFNFRPIDMEPFETSIHEMHRIAFSNISPFKNLIVEENKRIILPQEYNISEMLAMIIKKQEPGQQEYFSKMVDDRKRSVKVSAQILQMVA